MADLFTFTVKSAPEHREDMLRTLSAALKRRGIQNPNVGPDSDFYAIATMLANELAVVGANNVLKADEAMPDTAEDDEEAGVDALSRWAQICGLTKRPASGSIGFVVNDVTSPTTIAAGAELVDPLGQRYRVTVGGTGIADNEPVAIEAIATGRATNLAAGTTLKWQSAPPYSAPNVVVAEGGLVNGTDKETNEELRARIFEFFQNPPAAGNWSHVARIAEASTPRVQKAFVYPAIQGGATLHVAVTASPTDTNKSRAVNASVMSGTVIPYVAGQLPEHVAVTTTSVEDVEVDIAFGLTLPEAPTASPPGPGGGWKDGSPWPRVDSATRFYCRVTAFDSSTRIYCDALTLPTKGVTRICWLAPGTWKLHKARVIDVHNTTPGSIGFTIDQPFPGLSTDSLIWPDCEIADELVARVLEAFSTMGPGEKTANASALVRGFRHPRSFAAYPYTLGSHLTGALLDIAGVEVAQYLHRTDGVQTSTLPSGVIAPQVPAIVSLPPKQFIPRNIGFYRLP